MENPFKRTTPDTLTTEQADAIAESISNVFAQIESTTKKVLSAQHEALLDITTQVGQDDRLTDYMVEHTNPSHWTDPKYVAILETIQPGSAEQFFDLTEAKLQAEHRQKLRQDLSLKNFGRHILNGFASFYPHSRS